ncbi:fibrobacter succinogenes major paralogous domain-containing protein [Candidatus Pacearchaeota archaeon]|nr:fibrobacter succinogenes major paralogous domain-containing protein [Candidatus Pacearchaeota archaeon]
MALEKILNKTKKIAKGVLTTALAGSLFLSGCKKPEIIPVTLPTSAEKVIVLPENILNDVSSYNYNNGEIIFSNPTNYSVGDILVADISAKTPDGFLRQITGISSDNKTIQTKQAALEQAVETGYLEFQKQLTPAGKNKSGTIKSIEGVELIQGSAFDFNYQLTNVVLYDVDGNLSTTNDQILANGYINFNNSLDVKLNIENRKIDYFLFQNTITENSQIKITSNTSLSVDYEKTIWSKKFGAINIGYIPTPVGPLPVIVTPQLDVNVGVNGSVLVNIETDVTQTASLTGGVSYNNNQWNDLKNFTNSFNFNPPQVSGNLNFKGFAGIELDLLLYGVAGPYAGAEAYGKLNASGSPISWTLYGGLEVIAGAKIEALSKTWADYNATVISNENVLAQGGGGGFCGDGICGNSPGEDAFSCSQDCGGPPSTITDSRDGQVYNIIQIGTQWWMAENLNYDQNSYGDDWCWNNLVDNCNIYGRLYDWNAIMQGATSSISNPSGVQGICPTGWHVPSDAEWSNLVNYLGGDSVAGGKMKETGTSYWTTPNTGATNISGFTALPGGYRSAGWFGGINGYGHWWSATENSGLYARMHTLRYYSTQVYNSNEEKTDGRSCRCVKD